MESSTVSFPSKAIDDLTLAHEVSVNSLTGTAVMTVPLRLTPGREGFGPTLSLRYQSGSGNSPYGVGWALGGLSAVGIDAAERAPRYDGTDGYLANGDQLVPWLVNNGGNWEPRVDNGPEFRVHYYRSKVERAFTRVEKWIEKATGRIHWRSRDRNNVVSIYGLDPAGSTRIADANAPERIFLWLIEAQFDSHGNAIFFEYASENADNVDRSQSFERHRLQAGIGYTQRYLKRVRYGNTKPLAPNAPEPGGNKWVFEAVFDFGDHDDGALPTPAPTRPWPARPDAHSNYRPGFEVRTHRLCQRVLMFHHFDELGPDAVLVGAMRLEHRLDPAGSVLERIRFTGHRKDPTTGELTEKSVPPLELTYTTPQVGRTLHAPPEETTRNLPRGLTGTRYRWMDLFGEGLPGILSETDDAWYYKPNLGQGTFGPQQRVAVKPSQRLGNYTLSDFDRDGNLNLVVLQGREAGYCEYDRDRGQWRAFTPFAASPHVEAQGRQEWLDLNGDGRPDIVVAREDRFTWYPSKGKEGFDRPIDIIEPRSNGTTQAPTVREELRLGLMFADMTGDGSLDLVRVRNGRVEYWPHLGNGVFGSGVLMEDAPRFDLDDQFDAARIRLVDLDGSGTTDLLYIGRGEIRYWINASGDRFVEGARLTDLPFIDNVSTAKVLDFLGDGTPCLVWSSPLAADTQTPLHYLQLTEGIPPRLLISVDNSMSAEIRLTYSSSATHYLRDKQAGREWISKLPAHSTVVERKEILDQIGGGKFVNRYEYHHGFFDSQRRAFRGFGRVDRYDSETFESGSGIAEEDFSAPVCVRTWHHNGVFGWDARRAESFYDGASDQHLLPTPAIEGADELNGTVFAQGLRALAGLSIREETFGVDASGELRPHPFAVTQRSYRVRRLQPATDGADAVFYAYQNEAVTFTYEQDPDDPRVAHAVVLDIDAFGNVLAECDVAYPRRGGGALFSAQQHVAITASTESFLNVDQSDRYQPGIPLESREYELAHTMPDGPGLFRYEELETKVTTVLAAPLDFHEAIGRAPSPPQSRLIRWDQSYYWNGGRTDALPLGQVGSPVLIHHEESACFTTPWISDVFGSRVDANLLQTRGRYVERDGYWWQRSDVQHYAAADRFFRLTREEREDGSTVDHVYDAPYALAVVEMRDGLNNRLRGEIDYNLVEPWRITDPNDNVSEVLYDPLGAIVVSTDRGDVLDSGGTVRQLGNELLDTYVLRTDASLVNVTSDPTRYLQLCGRFFFYDLDGWSTAGRPPVTVSVEREALVHDGRGGGTPGGRVQVNVSYADGLGRVLQSKTLVEDGLAIQRDGSGNVVVDAGGVPIEADVGPRWLVSGFIVLNNKQQPVRQYEPFFSASFELEYDEVLRELGVATNLRYDPLGRLVSQEMPNGTRTRVETTAWEIRSHDANDTVAGSDYEAQRAGLPANDPERQALDKALAHANTPTILHLDVAGNEVRQEEVGAGGASLITETRLDARGETVEIVDPRGLTAFAYRLDMLGRTLFESSVDAGDRWILLNSLDQPIDRWDGRGVHVTSTFDILGRPVTSTVDGALGLNQVVERLDYGDDSADPQAHLRNARGRVVRHRDQAGVLRVTQYTADGNTMRSSRQLLQGFDAEPDWTSPALVALDGDVFETEIAYDSLGRVVSQSLPDGTTRVHRHLQGGGVDQIRVTTADGLISDLPVLAGSSFNARGQRSQRALGNGIETEYDYDASTHLLVGLATSRPVGATRAQTELIQDLRYTFDPAGNVTRVVDQVQQPGPPSPVIQGSGVSAHADYTYDAFYRLTSSSGRVHQALLQHDYRGGLPDGNAVKSTRHITLNNGAALERYTRTYECDDSGNLRRIRHQGVSQSWTSDIWTSPGSNRSLPERDIAGNPTTNRELRFDANGNTTYLPHVAAIDWNFRNHISRAVVIDRSTAGQPDDAEFYVYGGDGIRVRKVTQRLIAPGQVETCDKIYLDGCEIKRVRRNGTLILRRVTSHISDADDRIAVLHHWSVDTLARETADVTRKTVRYQLSDQLGSSALEADENGDIVSYEEYFPFGGTAFIAGGSLRRLGFKDHRFTGKERDDATGLYYFGYRYYAPWIGRWLSPDPIGPEDSFNLYEFVHNNPINLVDPTGLQATETPQPTPGRLWVVQIEEIPEAYREAWAGLTKEQRQQVSRGERVLTPLGELLTLREFHKRAAERRALGEDVRLNVRTTPQPEPEPIEFGSGEPVTEITFGEDEGSLVTPGEEHDPDVIIVGGPEDGDDLTGGGIFGPSASADGDSGGSGASPGDTNSSASHRADGSNRSSTDSGNGSGSGGQQGRGRGTAGYANGPGLGLRGTGPGGGGTTAGTGTGTVAGRGPGAGSGGTGTGDETPGAGGVGPGGRGTGDGARSGDTSSGDPNGSPSGSPNGAPGGDPNGVPTGSPSGSPTGVEGGVRGGFLDGDPSINPDLTPSSQGQPAPPGVDVNGDDLNGTPDGSPDGITGGTGGPGGPGARPGGSPEGSPEGQEGGKGTQAGTPTTETALDTVTRWAGYWHLEFGNDEQQGQSGGIPGGMGSLNLGAVGQVAFLALTVADIVLTVVSLGSLAAIKTGLKVGIKSLFRGAMAAARRVLPAARALFLRAGTLFRSRWPRTLWRRGNREFSTAWNNVRQRLNRIVHGRPTNPQVFDPHFGRMAAGTWHHGVLGQRHIRFLSSISGRFSPRLARAIERFGHGTAKLLPRSGHAMADRFYHVRGFRVPWWSRGRFNPVRTWIGLTPVQRFWGSIAVAGTGYGSYRLGSEIYEAISGEEDE